MSKIREVTISGNEYFLDTIIGYDGEHKITNLNIKLPSELISDDIDHYTVEFQTQNGDVISSGNIQQNGGYVVVSPWQDVMVFGQLKFQVTAWAMTGDTIDKIAKSPVITRLVGESVDGDAVLLDENVGGLMVELQQLIANYPVMMGTFTAGDEWDFELVDGLLNIVYVPATDGEDGLNGITPEIGENGNWFVDGVDTGILADVSLIDLSGYELNSNKVTSINSNSTDEQYASAKLIYTELLSKLSAEYPEVPTQSNFLRDDGVFAEVYETVEKFSDLPENGTIALVQNDEVITQEQSDFEADIEYDLFVNPQIPLDFDFEVTLIHSESEFDNGAITLTLNTTELSHPVFTIEAKITDGQIVTVKQWHYAENEIISETLTILKGWSAVEFVDDVVIKNESISYTDLPNLDGTFIEANSLGGTYFSETPYSMNKAGLYEFNGSWERVDNDKSLWCKSTGYFSTANGYDTTASGSVATANGIDTTASGSVATANGIDTTASGDAATANGISTTASGTAATANGSNTTASGDAATANGISTTASGTAATANGSNTTASGDAATANGYGTTASALAATANGEGTTASGAASASFGRYTNAKHASSTIVGKFGETNTDTLFAVANGTSTANKSLALNVATDIAEFAVPVISPRRYEYYSQEVDKIKPYILNLDIVLDYRLYNLPDNPKIGFCGEFELLIHVTSQLATISFNTAVWWEDGTPHVFDAGTHLIKGFYNPLGDVWALKAEKYALPPT